MMEALIKTLSAAFVGILFYLCWFVLPPLKKHYIDTFEAKLTKKGWGVQYRQLYKAIKTSLWVILALMIALPILLIVILLAWK